MTTAAESRTTSGSFSLGGVGGVPHANSKPTATLLGGDATLTGDIQSSTDIVIAGKVEGEITCDGRLVIASSGSVTGRVVASEIIIEGQLKGNSTANKTLSILKSARVDGDVVTPSIMIEPGAVFVGRCSMTQNAE